MILSSDEEDDNLEPIISKVEASEALKKHLDKLKCMILLYTYNIFNNKLLIINSIFLVNPKLLEDKLWQKDLSVKDYFKIEECHSVHIGNFETTPAACGDMLVSLHGIRMVIRNLGELILN